MKTDPTESFVIPDGVYPAIAGGYETCFTVGGKKRTARSNDIGVKGFGIKDTVTSIGGQLISETLGPVVLGVTRSGQVFYPCSKTPT